jgi:eukaryotic translation initiation factor 2C
MFDTLPLSNQLGGLNSLLQIEVSPSIPLVSKSPTIILGMDVSHGSPGQSDVPSIAAVSMLCSFRVIF